LSHIFDALCPFVPLRVVSDAMVKITVNVGSAIVTYNDDREFFRTLSELPSFEEWYREEPRCQSYVLRSKALARPPISLGRQFTGYDLQTGGVSRRSQVSSGRFSLDTFVAEAKRQPHTLGQVSTSYLIIQKVDVIHCSMCLMKVSPCATKTSSKSSTALSTKGRQTTSGNDHYARKHPNVAPKATPPSSLEEQVCLLLAVKNLPFVLVDSPFFQKCLPGAVGKRTTMSTRVLENVGSKFNVALSEAVADEYCHIGFDLWSACNGHHYLVSTLQWIDASWQLQRAGLGIVPMTEQTADAIVKSTRGSLCNVNVDEAKVASVATDGASNETAAATFQGFCDQAEHVWCLLHQFNLCIGKQHPIIILVILSKLTYAFFFSLLYYRRCI
jgi:hypothetical protein